MPTIRKLTPEEEAVCQRLAAARRFAGLSQGQLAAAIGITRDQLANIETGRTELGFTLGWNACKRLNIRQLYLATGDHPLAPFYPPTSLFDLPSPNTSFRRACLTGKVAMELRFISYAVQEPAADSIDAYERSASSIVRTFLLRLPSAHYPELLACLHSSLRSFMDDLLHPADHQKQGLTNLSEIRKVPEVKVPTIQQLLDITRKIVKPSGMKAALAAHLGVPQSRVSEWLGGKYEPSGEVALRLLEWVTDSERKQNTLGIATNNPKGKPTQRKEIREENQSKDRKKS